MIDRDLILAYVDGTKSFVQLSSAGLLVPIAIRSEALGFLHLQGTASRAYIGLTCVSWLLFLVAIGAGLLYQYAAIKFLEHQSDERAYVPRLLRSLVLVRGPGIAYGVMVSTFYAGAISVIICAANALFAS
jgi:hypothetical protein